MSKNNFIASTYFSYNPVDDIQSEKNTLPSKTVPDMDVGLKELLEQYSRDGILRRKIEELQGYYEFDGEIAETFDNLGLTDTMRMDRLELQEKYLIIKNMIKDARRTKQVPDPASVEDPKLDAKTSSTVIETDIVEHSKGTGKKVPADSDK